MLSRACGELLVEIGLTSAAIRSTRLLHAEVVRARGRRRPPSMNSSMSSSLSPCSRSSARMLVVGDLDAELVGDRLEHELARDRLRGLGAEPLLERSAPLRPVSWRYAADVDAARLELADEAR